MMYVSTASHIHHLQGLLETSTTPKSDDARHGSSSSRAEIDQLPVAYVSDYLLSHCTSYDVVINTVFQTRIFSTYTFS